VRKNDVFIDRVLVYSLLAIWLVVFAYLFYQLMMKAVGG